MGEVSETLIAFHQFCHGFCLPLPNFTLAIVRILPLLLRKSYLRAEAEVYHHIVSIGVCVCVRARVTGGHRTSGQKYTTAFSGRWRF